VWTEPIVRLRILSPNPTYFRIPRQYSESKVRGVAMSCRFHNNRFLIHLYLAIGQLSSSTLSRS